MKTKQITKQRTQLRDFEVATLDCSKEFGDILTDEFLDPDALAEIEDDE